MTTQTQQPGVPVQLSFDDLVAPEAHTRHRSTDHYTSIQAAHSIHKDITGIQRLVLQYVSSCQGGCTQEQAQLALCRPYGLKESSVRTRFSELENQGKLRKTQRTRPTTSGRAAVVWEATGQGQQALRAV